MDKFKIGDVVFLKSGSERLTISRVDDDYVYCSWFSFVNGEFYCERLHEDCLEEAAND